MLSAIEIKSSLYARKTTDNFLIVKIAYKDPNVVHQLLLRGMINDIKHDLNVVVGPNKAQDGTLQCATPPEIQWIGQMKKRDSILLCMIQECENVFIHVRYQTYLGRPES